MHTSRETVAVSRSNGIMYSRSPQHVGEVLQCDMDPYNAADRERSRRRSSDFYPRKKWLLALLMENRLLGNLGREDTPQRRLARSSCSFLQPVAVENNRVVNIRCWKFFVKFSYASNPYENILNENFPIYGSFNLKFCAIWVFFFHCWEGCSPPSIKQPTTAVVMCMLLIVHVPVIFGVSPTSVFMYLP